MKIFTKTIFILCITTIVVLAASLARAATGGSFTLNSSTPTAIFTAATDGGNCGSYSLQNTDTTNDALITVNGLHGNGAFDLPPGSAVTFTLAPGGINGIVSITALSSASSVIVKGGIAAR